MCKENSREYWCNVSVKAATKVPHNKPNLMLQDQEAKICSIIEFSCPFLVARNLQIMYPEYKFQVAPVVIETMGHVPKWLINYLKMTGFNKNESNILISKLEIKSISGTVKICKTFLNFHDPFHDFNFT